MSGQVRNIPLADLSDASADVYVAALRDAFEIGLEDGRAGRSDKAIKDPAADEDVVRAYLRGWTKGAGELSQQEAEALRNMGRD